MQLNQYRTTPDDSNNSKTPAELLRELIAGFADVKVEGDKTEGKTESAYAVRFREFLEPFVNFAASVKTQAECGLEEDTAKAVVVDGVTSEILKELFGRQEAFWANKEVAAALLADLAGSAQPLPSEFRGWTALEAATLYAEQENFTSAGYLTLDALEHLPPAAKVGRGEALSILGEACNRVDKSSEHSSEHLGLFVKLAVMKGFRVQFLPQEEKEEPGVISTTV